MNINFTVQDESINNKEFRFLETHSQNKSEKGMQ